MWCFSYKRITFYYSKNNDQQIKTDILSQLSTKRRQIIEIDEDFDIFFEDCREKLIVMDYYLKIGINKIKGKQFYI